MARFAEKHQEKYFSLVYKGIRFKQYVGVIQVGRLTIEILPKADKNPPSDFGQWHDVLVGMLQSCQLLRIETLNAAQLKLRPNSILELYFESFLKEVSILLRRGLLRSYQLEEHLGTVVKGRINFAKQLRLAALQDTKFYTRYQNYNYDHLLNQIIWKALSILEQLLYRPDLVQKTKALLAHFPKMSNINITERHFQQISDQRKAKTYQKALEIARLIILNYSPDLRGGRHDLLAILFDMNLLFEEYVFRQIQKHQSKTIQIKRQAYRSFWNRKYIRPDLLITKNGKNYVLDTKWKVLKKVAPSIEDLRQLYVYCQYFDAQNGLLLYPKIHQLNNLPPQAYQATKKADESIFCQINFLPILKDGKLNRKLGEEILGSLV